MKIIVKHGTGQIAQTALEGERIVIEVNGEPAFVITQGDQDESIVVAGDWAIVIEPKSTNRVVISPRPDWAYKLEP